ncbi:Sjoegren syndrome nuclear autoantigen 1 [Heterodontus francisci]|uniref:Sjoegren syndrome nuclear autoantigen 1 n=1 Tax=Heterodontus francisci TaxID=7792 RepID=UPI00355BEF1E
MIANCRRGVTSLEAPECRRLMTDESLSGFLVTGRQSAAAVAGKGKNPPVVRRDERAAMSHQGAALQSYNNELVKCIEDLCTKREELNQQILQEEEEKNKLQNDIRILTEKLAKVNESLARKMATRNEFDRTIAETEAAYMKILESSQTLLTVLKREAGTLNQVNENSDIKDS